MVQTSLFKTELFLHEKVGFLKVRIPQVDLIFQEYSGIYNFQNSQMNEHDLSSGTESGQDYSRQDELNERLLDNYKKIKDSIKRQQQSAYPDKTSLRSVEKAIELQQQKNLETRIALTEKQYSKARENNILLLKKLGEAEEYNEFLKFELQKAKRQRDEEQASFNEIVDNLKRELNILRDEQMKRTREVDNKEINSLQQTLQLRQKQISKLTLRIKSLEISLQQTQSLHKQSLAQIEQLNHKIHDLQFEPHRFLQQQINGSQMIEVDQLRKALQRLLYIFKGTDYYKSFCLYAENSRQIYFLDQIAFGAGSNCCDSRAKQIKSKVVADERLLWSPTNCYKAMQCIKEKYQILNEQCIQQILFELNKLYLLKEQNAVKKVKEQLQASMQKMKQKQLYRYDQLVARKQIQRLKKQLQQNRFSKVMQTQELTILKNLGDYEDQIRLRDKEIKLLSQRLQLLESQNMSYDKVIYLEGALWLIDKVLDEVTLYREELSMAESSLSSKPAWNNEEAQLLLRELGQSFGQAAASLHQKLLLMKETTLKKMNLIQKQKNQDISQLPLP